MRCSRVTDPIEPANDVDAVTRRSGGRRAVVILTLFGVLAGAFVLTAPLLGVDGPAAARQWLSRAQGPWALAAVVGAFAALAFIGVPQVVLIAAAVAAFGPWRGAGYAWTGTMVSALIGFAIGRAVGARAAGDPDAIGDRRIDRFMRLIGKNGMLASLIVRLVPMAPFVMVNTAAGVAPISVFDFIVGTAIGIVPKIALTAFAGGAIMRFIGGPA